MNGGGFHTRGSSGAHPRLVAAERVPATPGDGAPRERSRRPAPDERARAQPSGAGAAHRPKLRLEKALDRAEDNDGDGVVEHRLAEEDVVQVRVHLEQLEQRERRDGVDGGDECRERTSLNHRQF